MGVEKLTDVVLSVWSTVSRQVFVHIFPVTACWNLEEKNAYPSLCDHNSLNEDVSGKSAGTPNTRKMWTFKYIEFWVQPEKCGYNQYFLSTFGVKNIHIGVLGRGVINRKKFINL